MLEWRKVLRDFITYFREMQTQYEARARGINRISQALRNTAHPNEFLAQGGIMETITILSDFHKEAGLNAESATRIENDVINTLVALRSDLNVKIREIKALSGDFKSNVEKEKENTKKEVLRLKESLDAFDSSPTPGKDP